MSKNIHQGSPAIDKYADREPFIPQLKFLNTRHKGAKSLTENSANDPVYHPDYKVLKQRLDKGSVKFGNFAARKELFRAAEGPEGYDKEQINRGFLMQSDK